ncbi:hypothetical protein A2767_04415 [Candidatus Roizmanbacteria bacterium RIFCSPHIGHO2_01_FULL_35_10]|uniref:SD-repeat containing protein B domain-containing protein n=1 Tax=Candidatus Roizmanbacteria bacterium RIFCSPLOWO2_01_FULL_35_13 TaxID=1802055 RepID=A0A1F7I6N9_9BACT|nr:MAG: hypothetical protein A2767_04415 [Candidatus Roizmanbacteria bacterium RIFCSPHIGHO2_01_FULL_35_10]OGK39027.1 MAG: hypothetical protein A3A74_04530 [Candidatus Roizmanbacteria bacterium RIFCSPLOWO2_01_FULL_35_13]
MESYFHKYVKRIELFIIAIVILIVILASRLIQENKDIRSDAAATQNISTQNVLTIAGYVYLDQNQNGERDLEEKGISGGVVQIRQLTNYANKTNPSTDAKTDSYGYFKYTTSPPSSALNFSITLLPPPSYKVTSKNPLYRYGLSKNEKRIVEFSVINSEATTPNPTPTTIVIDECVWCGSNCVDGPLKPGQPCNLAFPPEGAVCKRVAGVCQAIKATVTTVPCPSPPRCGPGGNLIIGDPPPGTVPNCPTYVCNYPPPIPN